MTYYVGLAVRGKTLVIQAKRSVDFLDCEIYDYMGERETTKAALRVGRYRFLDFAKVWRPSVYGGLRYAVVE